MIRGFLIPVAIVAIFIVGAVMLMATAPALEPDTPEPIALSVRILTAEPRTVQLTVKSQGTVEPAVESQLIPEVSGRVEWVSPVLVAGGRFKVGDTLLRVDTEDYRNAAARARASLSRAEAEQENAAFEHQRLAGLAKRQLVSQSQLESALRTLRVADAVLEEARIGASQARLDLSRTDLKAPFDGLVRSESVDVGQFVSRGTAVGTIYEEQTSEVRLPIADRQLAYLNIPFGARGTLAPEQQSTVILRAEYGGEQLAWTGRIVRTEAAIDRASRMVYLVASIDRADGQPNPAVGLFVDAEIQGREADDIVILPRSALRNDRQVLIVDDEDRLRFRPIKPLRLFEEELLVESGLKAGDRVCVSQIQTVVEGMSVIPLEAPPSAQEPLANGLPLSQR